MPIRMEPEAAEHLRQLIREAPRGEVFAIGEVTSRVIVSLAPTRRGEPGGAELLDRPRPGQVVLHSHPSSDPTPSELDRRLIERYARGGVGFVIVDRDVSVDRWEVEPGRAGEQVVASEALEAFFGEGLASALEGWEARPEQLQMARRVARCLEEQRPLLCEAGTGTGKSLAYLAPAALWAQANDAMVVVSTFTKALQMQLLASDLPLLRAGGLDVRTAVLQGRNNYLCRRRLQLLVEDGSSDDDALAELWDWSRITEEGTRAELAFPVPAGLWERVLSDHDLTLSVGCPHYAECHYYRARRAAAEAHVLVVNHALLLMDLSIRASTGRGLLPRYRRLIIDEAHHLESAATAVASDRLSARAVRHALAGLTDTRWRRGALSRLVASAPRPRPELSAAAASTTRRVDDVVAQVDAIFERIERASLAGGQEPLRVTTELEAGERWSGSVVPAVEQLTDDLHRLCRHLDLLAGWFRELGLPPDRAQPLLDLRRSRRRLRRHLRVIEAFLEPDPGRCRWIEAVESGGRAQSSALCSAPIALSELLQQLLWGPFGGVVCTSATLTVGGRFTHWRSAVGLADAELDELDELVLPSPFDHASVALLGLPRDLPVPEDPRYLQATAEVIADAVACSDGGAFVLCTSHAAVATYHELLSDSPEVGTRPILAQGQLGRAALLQRFREDRRAVLIGTDSFWEGVSVRGEGLRLVIVPRLPFRVPTEPLQQARYERIAAQGRDPFWEVSLPEAVVKLRQGYGRLIRSHSDRGVVLLLDRRLHDRRYGAIVLRSLPPARRVKGPWRRVREAVVEMLGEG